MDLRMRLIYPIKYPFLSNANYGEFQTTNLHLDFRYRHALIFVKLNPIDGF